MMILDDSYDSDETKASFDIRKELYDSDQKPKTQYVTIEENDENRQRVNVYASEPHSPAKKEIKELTINKKAQTESGERKNRMKSRHDDDSSQAPTKKSRNLSRAV